MKNLFTSVSTENLARFVFQHAVPNSAAAEWKESEEASKEASEARDEAVNAFTNAAEKTYEQTGEFADAVGEQISESAKELNTAIQNKYDSAKSSMWSFAIKMYGKGKEGMASAKVAYNKAVNKVDEVVDRAGKAAVDAYDSTNETIAEVATVVVGASLIVGEKIIDESVDGARYVYKKGGEGVAAVGDGLEAGYDATMEFGNDVADGFAGAAQTAGDLARGVDDMVDGAIARGRDIRIAEASKNQPSKAIQSEQTAVANDNLSSIPDHMKNIGSNVGEMMKNISPSDRVDAFNKFFPLANFEDFKYKNGLNTAGNQKLFSYLENNK